MAEPTKSFNELLLELLGTELLAIKKAVSGYFIDVNSFYPFIVDPLIDNIQASEYMVTYTVVGDETAVDTLASKSQANNLVDVEIGIVYKVSRTDSEAEKENIKKSIKHYLKSGNTIASVRGFDARFLSKTNPKVKCYTHDKDSGILMLTFNFQIKTYLI
jgi:hypothetical protein